MDIVIKTRQTARHGLAFDLDYRWQGKRYRPLLGYNLTKAEAERQAVALIAKIQAADHQGTPPHPSSLTFRQFLPVYWQALKIKNRVDQRRPSSILDTHLLPRFGDRVLSSLTAEDGLRYITDRLNSHAAPWTIRREWNVLMRVLNLAVDYDKLDKNRLKRVQLPDVANRERVATDEELTAIQKIAPAELWRVILVALHTGLREAKILEIGRSWVRLRDDGAWLILPPARSRLKGTPREIPLNRIAFKALQTDVPTIEDRLFPRWNAAALGTYWRRICQRAKVQDLHFHDLRHTFTTRLQNLGVGLEIRATLLGHRIRPLGGDQLGAEAMTSAYSHGGPGWNQELRRAVTLLEKAYRLADDLADEVFQNVVARVVNGPKSLKAEGERWWSQRDSNPCLSLESRF